MFRWEQPAVSRSQLEIDANSRHTTCMARLVPLLILVLAAALLPGVLPGARAQDDSGQVSFITPFPENDTYKLQVVGDWWAEGMIEGLVEAFTGDSRVQIARKGRPITSLFRNDFEEDMKALDDSMARDRNHVVIVMFGIADRVSVRLANGRRAAVGSEEWRAEYTRRIDRVIRALRKPAAAVYWVSQPKLGREEADEDAQMMNQIVRERVYLNSLKYIDVHSAFADEAGSFNPRGPDLTGKIRLLRDVDGIGFTGTGYRKLAHFVEREVKRDLLQARGERSIPLAGTEAEQSRVNPQRNAEATKAGSATDAPAATKSTGSGPGGPAGSPSQGTARRDQGLEQKADHGRITLKLAGADGREETLTMDLPRPAIPASVVALVARRQAGDKAPQPGDVLHEDIAGGLTVLSTITPTNDATAGRRRMSPTQTAYFRVLVKGEWLQPRPGRTDDFKWPRQDAVPPPASAVEPIAAPAPRITPAQQRQRAARGDARPLDPRSAD